MIIRFFAVLMIMIVGAAYAAPLNVYITPYKTEKSTIIFRPTKVTVICFLASWCPPCVRSEEMMVNLKKRYPSTAMHIFFLDSNNSIEAARIFGLKSKIPLILVADASGVVVKRFEALPDEKVFVDLIGRLHAGRLENGTLPPSLRVDLWEAKRGGI